MGKNTALDLFQTKGHPYSNRVIEILPLDADIHYALRHC